MASKEVSLLYYNGTDAAHFGNSRKEFPPIGLLYLASSLEARGYSVALYDIQMMSPDHLKKISNTVIGLSINASYVVPYFVDIIEKLPKARLIIGGGQHVSASPRESIDQFRLDFAFIGESEHTLPDFLDNYLISNIGYENIPGIAYIKNREYKYTGLASREKCLDDLPFPARHLLPEQDILLDKRIWGKDIKSVSMITSRGCVYNCNFCGNLYKSFYHRSAQNIENEIIHIEQQYPEAKGIVFLDENLLFCEDHILDLCNIMKNHNFLWTANARVDYMNETVGQAMYSSGCVEIKYGVESGSQRILNRMNKKITLRQVETALKCSAEVGIYNKCFLLYGYPGDNMESSNETIAFLQRNRRYINRVNLFDYTPLPTSRDYHTLLHKNSYQWGDFRIYRQHQHWWGSDSEYEEMLKGYFNLKEYIDKNFTEEV